MKKSLIRGMLALLAGVATSAVWGLSPTVATSPDGLNKIELARKDGVVKITSYRRGVPTVTATFGDCSLESTCSFSYGEHDVPQTAVELSYPVALLLNSNNVDSAKVGQVGVSFLSDIETNGTLRLYCTAGAQRVRMVGACTKSVTGDDSFIVDIEGVKPSDAMDDVSLSAEFTPDDGGEPLEVQATLTVVQVKDVVLPGAPADGLVISTGTSVAFDLDVVPAGAEEVYDEKRSKRAGFHTRAYGACEETENIPTGSMRRETTGELMRSTIRLPAGSIRFRRLQVSGQKRWTNGITCGRMILIVCTG